MASYPIAAVVRRTGLTADTIRAWERRHEMVSPARDLSGRRLYSEADVHRLQLARAAVSLGHPIASIASLSDANIQALIDRAQQAPVQSEIAVPAADRTVRAALDAVRSYDLLGAESTLNSAALFFSPVETIVAVLAPFMNAIGNAWEAGTISIAQEHFASHLVRNVAGGMIRTAPRGTGSTVLFATPTDEAHEFGILFAATLAATAGFKVLVLGANVPVAEVARAARGCNAERIVIGVAHAPDPQATLAYLADLRNRIRSDVPIVVGGYALQDKLASLEGIAAVSTLDEFGQLLEQWR